MNVSTLAPPTLCPHCLTHPADLTAHLRDTGAATELRPGSCPVLFAMRNRPAS